MKPFKTEAIMLRRTNYGEADRIVNFLTPDHGKVSAIAKGVRKPKSKLAGGLELLATSDITIMRGRGEMGLVTSARLDQFFGDILQEYERMEFAYEAIKRINKATETVAEPEFYYLLRDTFTFLNHLKIDWKITELWFRLRLLGLLGHGFNVATDRTGAALQADGRYYYDPADGAFFADPRGKYNSEHIKLLRLTSIKNPAILAQVGGVGELINDCVQLVRLAE